MRETFVPWRILFAALLAVGVGGCSHDFWYRTPRVAGRVQAPTPMAPSDGTTSALPPPQVREVPYGTAPAPEPGASDAPLTLLPDPTREEQMVLRHVNGIRRSRGLRELAWNAQLFRAAQEHSLEQMTHGYMGHDSPDPRRRTLVQRMNLAGYQGSMYGEVVAWGYRDAQAVVEGWMNSPEHRAILVDGELMEAGFGRVGPYWTGNFGSPFPAPTRAYVDPPARAAPAPSRPRAFAPSPPRAAPSVVPAPRSAPSPSAAWTPPAPSAPAPRVRPTPPAPTPTVPPPRPVRGPIRGG